MEKEKTLSINIILFSISSFGTKFLSFFLVPFYTNFLSTSEYGIIDLIINTASLLLPIFTLTVYDGVMRFTLSEKTNDEYLRIGIKISSIGGIILALLIVAVGFVFHNSIQKSYLIWIWVIFCCNAFYSLITNYMRAVDKVSIMVQGSLLNSFLLLCSNILFIAVFHIGVNGYFISMVIGLISSTFFMLFRGSFQVRTLSLKRKISKEATKELLSYSTPLIFTAIAWWTNSSLDRYFVTALCGIDANGIYSVAYKIPNLLTAFQTIFTQAWAISAVSEFDKNDTDGFMGHTYEVFSMFMLLACMWLMIINIPLSGILYANAFFEAWKYVPFLLSSTLFGSLAGYFGGIFAAVKDSKICAISTMTSALINTILNFSLIPILGVQGAAISTLIAYFTSWIMRVYAAQKYIKLKVHIGKMWISYFLLLIQLLCAVSKSHLYYIQAALILAVMVLYRNILINDAKKIFKRFNGK